MSSGWRLGPNEIVQKAPRPNWREMLRIEWTVELASGLRVSLNEPDWTLKVWMPSTCADGSWIGGARRPHLLRVARDLLDVVHQAIQLPLGGHLCTTAQGQAAHALVMADVGEHRSTGAMRWLYRCR